MADPQEEQTNTPPWWRARLIKAMDNRDQALRQLDDYYSGRQRLAFATEQFRRAFGPNFPTFSDNWCALVVDAVEERLNVEGFRVVTTAPDQARRLQRVALAAEEDSTGDSEAWDIWQRNLLDRESQVAHTEALINSECSALVWPDADGKPEITIEHPRQMIVEHSASNRHRRLAALKRWLDDDGYLRATLYLPAEVYKWRSDQKHKRNDDGSVPGYSHVNWTDFQPPEDPAWPLKNPLGVVPAVAMYNRPRLLRYGESEIAAVMPVQDAVNKITVDLMVASEFAAFPQRWATGLELPRDQETNQVIEPFRAALDRLWTAEWDPSSGGPEPKFGQFAAADLGNYVKAIEMFIQHIASQTRTPPHYFYLSGQFPSGDALRAAEAGLVSKARRRQRSFGEAWEEIIRLAFKVAGDDAKANATSTETIWKDPETHTESMFVDAVMKMQSLGVPMEVLWERLGFSPQQIERMKRMREEEAASAFTVYDAMTNSMVQIKDPNLRREVPPGTQQEPRLPAGSVPGPAPAPGTFNQPG